MQLKVTTDYAIRIILHLAKMQTVLSSAEIAMAMKIPQNCVLKVTQKLVKAGLLKAILGKHGGFSLNRSSSALTLHEIVEVMEPTKYINHCLESDKYCSRSAANYCPVRNFYIQLQEDVEKRFKEVTIEKLICDKGFVKKEKSTI